MVKIHTTVSIDAELKQKADENNIKMSETLEEALKLKLRPMEENSNEIDEIVQHKKIVTDYFQKNGAAKARPFAILYLYDKGYTVKEIRQLLINWLPIKAYTFTANSVQYELRLLVAQRKQKRLEKVSKEVLEE